MRWKAAATAGSGSTEPRLRSRPIRRPLPGPRPRPMRRPQPYRPFPRRPTWAAVPCGRPGPARAVRSPRGAATAAKAKPARARRLWPQALPERHRRVGTGRPGLRRRDFRATPSRRLPAERFGPTAAKARQARRNVGPCVPSGRNALDSRNLLMLAGARSCARRDGGVLARLPRPGLMRKERPGRPPAGAAGAGERTPSPWCRLPRRWPWRSSRRGSRQ
jgi:hypothetical protein